MTWIMASTDLILTQVDNGYKCLVGSIFGISSLWVLVIA
jgi:hypothetical protein